MKRGLCRCSKPRTVSCRKQAKRKGFVFINKTFFFLFLFILNYKYLLKLLRSVHHKLSVYQATCRLTTCPTKWKCYRTKYHRANHTSMITYLAALSKWYSLLIKTKMRLMLSINLNDNSDYRKYSVFQHN